MIKYNQDGYSLTLWDFHKAIPSDSNTDVSIKSIPNGRNTGVDIDIWHNIYLSFGLDAHSKA